jgi:hypothetical protein
MDPNVFDNVPQDNAVKLDIYTTTGVMSRLYDLEGGDKLIQQKKNEDRLVQIDRYYIAKYKAETRVLQSVVFFCCVAMVGSVLFNKGLISLLSFTMYIGFVGIIMLYVIGRDIYNIFIRDSANYDEIDYNFYYTPPGSNASGQNYTSAELSNMPSCPS